MVSRIENTALGKVATILDFKNNEICKITAGNIIYAGNKHALKHIYPEDYHLFSDTEYAPWLVVNVIIENKLEDIGFWQNEMIVEDSSFLGFVDSSLQYPDRKDFRVLTCYYCLTPESREDLVNMEANKETIAEKTINYIEDYFGRSVSSMVRGVNIKAMGHAMPIPAPGYLFKDANTPEKSQLIYAGVDNGNLPLFFEAADSGLMAASIIT